MTFTFALTQDDLREAARPTLSDGRPVRRWGVIARLVWGWSAAAAVGVMVVAAFARARPGSFPRPSPSPVPAVLPTQNLWVTVVPNLVPAVMAVMIVGVPAVRDWIAARRARAAVESGRPAPASRRLGPWLPIAVMAPLALLRVSDVPWLAIPWAPSADTAVWVAFAPWVVAFVVIAAVAGRHGRAAADRRWATLPAVRRATTVTVSDDGVRTADDQSDAFHRWPMVTRYRETPGLLVLSLDDGRQLLWPKRAVAGSAAEDHLRSAVQTHVAEGTFLPRAVAFPVLPVRVAA